MPEQPKLNWSQLMDEALNAPGNLTGVYDRFHEYSITNMILFLSQGIHEPVASYKRWQSLGRHVLKGTRAKEVIVPVLVKGEPEPVQEDEPIEQKRERIARLVGFKLVRGVFPLSDTEGKEPPPVQLPGWDVETALEKLKITRVPFEALDGNIQGYSRGREIALNPIAVSPEKTLFHELGHVVLGHTLTSQLSEYAQHRGIMEFQAEATSYLALNELEKLDEETASHSRGYIRHWLSNEQPPGEREIRLVFAATETILKAGRLTQVSDTVQDGQTRTRPTEDSREVW